MRILVFLAIISQSGLAFDNVTMINCTHAPETQLTPAWNYWITVSQTFLGVIQIIGGPINFIADWIFYQKHHSKRVIRARNNLAVVRGQQKILRTEGKTLILKTISQVEAYLSGAESKIENDDELCAKLVLVAKFLNRLADSNEPLAEEVLAE